MGGSGRQTILAHCLRWTISIVAILLTLSAPVAGQTDTIPPATPFAIGVSYVDLSTAPADGLVLYQDGVISHSQPTAPEVVFTFPNGLTAGTYVFMPAAYRVVEGVRLESSGNPTLTLTVGTTPQAACSDGLDNDGDGLIDFPADPGCSSATDTDEFNTTPSCTFQFSPPSVGSVPASGGSDGVSLTASDQSCAWTSTSNATWLSSTPTSGVGSRGLEYTVQVNTGPQRTGAITIGNATFTVTQTGTTAPPPCTYTLQPTSSTATASGGNGSITVTASATDCQWTTSSNASWLTVGSGGTGSGVASYTVQPNSAGSREGTLTVAGLTFTVTQAAAPPAGMVLFVRNQCTPVFGADRSPDGTTGWTARFRFVNADGTFTEFASDNTSPYQRSTPANNPLQPGTYRIDIQWTKSGVTTVVYAPITFVCQ